jgi:hypothetical protein
MTCPRRLSTLLASALALLACGCAQNAIFELYVELPPPVRVTAATSMDEARFARVLMLPGAVTADLLWDGPRSRIATLGTDPSWIGLSVTRGVAGESDPISVRVAYCATSGDCESNDPSDWLGHQDLVIGRVFYTGRTSCFAVTQDDADLTDGLTLAATRTVDACSVGGCVEAPLDTTIFCSSPGRPETHFCALGRQGGYCDDLHDLVAPGLP